LNKPPTNAPAHQATTLQYNKARQAAITNEISEIVSGDAATKGLKYNIHDPTRNHDHHS
jgi:hypothetical protein